MELYRIGEFARLNGISVQLLKNYDQQGILPPYWKDETGRYYVDKQHITLMEQRYLNEAGLPLREARNLQETGSLEDWCAEFAQASAAVENRIFEMQTLLKFFNETLRYLEAIQQHTQWQVEPWVGGKFMPKERSSTLPWGKNGEPILQIWQKVALPGHFDPDGVQYHWGTLVPPDFPYDAEPYDVIPSGPCFVYAHSIPKYGEYDSERLRDQTIDFAEPLKIMEENGLKPRGVLLQRWLCTTHEVDGKPQVQAVTKIPLQQDDMGT